MATVLVTAGWGNVGRAVVARLQADGHRVTVLDGRPTPEGLRADRHVAGRSYSLESVTEALEGAEAVIHLEWSGGVHEANQDPGLAHDRNSTGFLALLERCRQDGRPLIYASSGVTDGRGTFGYVVYVREDEFAKARGALSL